MEVKKKGLCGCFLLSFFFFNFNLSLCRFIFSLFFVLVFWWACAIISCHPHDNQWQAKHRIRLLPSTFLVTSHRYIQHKYTHTNTYKHRYITKQNVKRRTRRRRRRRQIKYRKYIYVHVRRRKVQI